MLRALDGYVDAAVLQEIVDKFCRLHSRSPPMLLRRDQDVAASTSSSIHATALAPGSVAAASVGAAASVRPHFARPKLDAAALLSQAPAVSASATLTYSSRGALRFAVECSVASVIM